MNDTEATRTFQALALKLKEAQLSWLIDQVNSELTFGKSTTKQVSVQDKPRTMQGRPRRQAEEFVSASPFSAKEQLGILLDAIEQVLVGTAETQKEIIDLVGFVVEGVAIEFHSETPEIESFRYDRTDIAPRANSTQRLRVLLQELGEELKSAD